MSARARSLVMLLFLTACADPISESVLGPESSLRLSISGSGVTASLVPPPPGFGQVWLVDVNDHGHAVGTASRYGEFFFDFEERAVHWNGVTLEFLPDADASLSRAHGLDNRGRVAGEIWLDAEDGRGFLPKPVVWERVSGAWQVRSLCCGWEDGLPDAVQGAALDLSDDGRVLGTMFLPGESRGRLTVWHLSDDAREFLPQPATGFASLTAINSHGHVLATLQPSTTQGAAIWPGSGAWEPLLRDPGWDAVQAVAFNDVGQVLGVAWPTVAGRHQSILWDGETIVPLTETHFAPRGINNARQMVGTYWPPGTSRVPAIREPDGTIYELASPSPGSTFPMAIARGWAVGNLSLDGIVWRLAGCATERLSDEIDALLSQGLLSPGEARSLRAHVAAAVAAGDREDFDAVRGSLGAFINHVRALVRSGRLDADTAAGLVAATELLLSTCGN